MYEDSLGPPEDDRAPFRQRRNSIILRKTATKQVFDQKFEWLNSDSNHILARTQTSTWIGMQPLYKGQGCIGWSSARKRGEELWLEGRCHCQIGCLDNGKMDSQPSFAPTIYDVDFFNSRLHLSIPSADLGILFRKLPVQARPHSSLSPHNHHTLRCN